MNFLSVFLTKTLVVVEDFCTSSSPKCNVLYNIWFCTCLFLLCRWRQHWLNDLKFIVWTSTFLNVCPFFGNLVRLQLSQSYIIFYSFLKWIFYVFSLAPTLYSPYFFSICSIYARKRGFRGSKICSRRKMIEFLHGKSWSMDRTQSSHFHWEWREYQ